MEQVTDINRQVANIESFQTILSYDAAGRLSYDNNQGVKSIRYNLLGLPSNYQSGHQENEVFNVLRYNASYGYSSDGVKLRRKRWTYRESGSPDQASLQLPEHFTDYVGSLVFEDNQLKTVLFEGGYIDATDGSRHFYITDHQGNIRAVTDATGAVEQTNDYRPFGREFDAASTGTNPGLDRRYGGKEKDATLPSSPFYDFEARMYNPVYARFTTMDPMAEKYYSISPYAYCANDPVNLVDPDGKIIRIRNNSADALTDLARIAATRRGSTILSGLTESRNTYSLEPVVFSWNAGFTGREISYVTHPIICADFSSPSEFVYMGHELKHASDHDNGEIPVKRNGEVVSRPRAESSAVSFENYLRSVYGIPFLRKGYRGFVKGKNGFNPTIYRTKGERIKNFKKIDSNEGGTAYGYSYVRTSWGQTSTEYIVVGIDDNSEFYYEKYATEEEYQKAISEW